MTAADEGVRLEGRIRDAISLLQEVDRKIYQSTISTGPSTALKHADLFREALSALTSMGEERDKLRNIAGVAAWRFRCLERQFLREADLADLAPSFAEAAADLEAALTPQTEAQSHAALNHQTGEG